MEVFGVGPARAKFSAFSSPHLHVLASNKSWSNVKECKNEWTNQCEKVKHCTGNTDKKFLSHIQAFLQVQQRTQAEVPAHCLSFWETEIFQSLTKILTSPLDLVTVPRSKYRYKSLSIRGQLETNTNKA